MFYLVVRCINETKYTLGKPLTFSKKSNPANSKLVNRTRKAGIEHNWWHDMVTLQMVKIMMIIVILYAICWLPLHVVTLLGDLNPAMYDRPFMPIVWISFHWLAMSNSCYNPFIYYWMSNTFKLGFKSLLVCRCCLCKHQTTRQNNRGLWRNKARKVSPCGKSNVRQDVLRGRNRCLGSLECSRV